MFIGSMFVMFLIPIMLLLCCGIPLIIGICVYRDANKRVDCNPWLWALVAALTPSFMGLVVYMVIRRDYPPRVGTVGAANGDQYQHENCGVAPKEGLATWVKVLIVVMTLLIGICILAVVGVVLYSIIGSDIGATSYYHDF